MRSLLSVGLVACATMALVPLGCAAKIRYPVQQDDRPRVPDATAERLRACVDEFGGDLPRGEFTFDVALTVDEDGQVVDVKSKGVPHEELAICMRIALRGMTVPEELVRLRELRLPASPASTNGQAAAERGLVGHPGVLVAVGIALADLVIEAGPAIIIVIAASVEIGKSEIAEAARKRPKPNLNRCLDAAAGGGVLWDNLCNSITNKIHAQDCWELKLESEEMKRNWCKWRFGK
ncbi:hypothetical protein [Polyangium jinanense]|uniref:Lipoprotein n=1 Tax=Polyangium jinanense TaxID=2829994 RepID=A0A9X3X8Q5_9BACT|nr:hypothetical protein [Polyangium jinanense]MDC3960029.1 hypothetical protein [Polyangium jinanense]MDC3986247.1 hypothetical protein [Polyangium jinanense]